MMNSPDLPGVEVIWGGKLPSHGDFLWSNARTPARARFEDWLQLGMLQGRSQYGDAWRGLMARAPVWNFLIPPNALGLPVAVAGNLAASGDRVGRQYPFMVGYLFPQELLQRCTELVLELPMLVNVTGYQLQTAISRSLPRTVLDSIWADVFEKWRANWTPMVLPQIQQSVSSQSDILDVLGSHAGLSVGASESDLSTRPAMRESAYPWPDVMRSLQSPDCPSFWWTHPAGGSPLKALAYEAPLDGPLLTWLFGRGAR